MKIVSRRPRSTGADWLGAALRALDGVLARCMGIEEFCAEPRCIIRIRVAFADRDVCLAGGTRIGKGNQIGELHLWNEHLPAISDYESALAWALEIRRRFEFSFMCLASSLETDPRLQNLQAFRGGMTFAYGMQRTAKLRRVMAWYGIEIMPDEPGRFVWLGDFGNALFTLALICAYHPGASFGGRRLQRRRHELWLSRRVLCERYGHLDGTQRLGADGLRGKRKDAA